MTLTIFELSKLLQRSIVEVNNFETILIAEFNSQCKLHNIPIPFHSQNSVDLAPRFISNKDIDQSCFTTDDIQIDETLGVGIFTRGITEIFGESSTGKSQLLIQLSLTVQLPLEKNGLNGKVYLLLQRVICLHNGCDKC